MHVICFKERWHLFGGWQSMRTWGDETEMQMTVQVLYLQRTCNAVETTGALQLQQMACAACLSKKGRRELVLQGQQAALVT